MGEASSFRKETIRSTQYTESYLKYYPDTVRKLNSPDLQRGKEYGLRRGTSGSCRRALERRVERYAWGTLIDKDGERHGYGQ